MVALSTARSTRRAAPSARGAGVGLVLLIAVGTAGCSGGSPAEATPSATGVVPSVAAVFPEACQDARTAFHAWSTADQAASEAVGDVIGRSIDLNVQVGQRMSENLQQLIDALNADVQTAQLRADESGELAAAYTSLFDSCLPLITDLPPACSDEIEQYPDVMGARTEVGQAQATLLVASTAVRDALIAGDESAVAVAVDQVAAAGDQLNASKEDWNNVVLPPFNAAVEACNAAIS